MPSISKKTKKGSRVTQRKNAERKAGNRPLTVDDFDLTVHQNGKFVDAIEGREARLPFIIRGMRKNLSIREIAFQCNCSPATVAKDKIWVLEEAWDLRRDMIGLWLEEQLQQYENMLSLLAKELMVEKMEKNKEKEWVKVLDAQGDPVMVTDAGIMSRMLSIMDKIDDLKGLKQAPVNLGINLPGDNATVNIGQDAAAARELLDILKPGKMGNGETTLVS